MYRSTISLAVVLALAAFAPGCATEADEAQPEASQSEDELVGKTVTEEDAGKPISIVEGTTLALRLAENPSTGYQWRVSRTDRSLGYPYRTRFIRSDSTAAGSGGERRMYWKTTSPISPLVGKHSISLEYARASGSPIKTLTFDVEIVAKGAAPSTVEIAGATGATYEVKVGQDVLVKLASNPSTGYNWQVKSTDRTFGYPAKTGWIQGDGAIGSSGWTTLLWHTNGPLSMVGDHTVALTLERGHGDSSSEFEFTIHVTE